jgi:hypothetical protein
MNQIRPKGTGKEWEARGLESAGREGGVVATASTVVRVLRGVEWNYAVGRCIAPRRMLPCIDSQFSLAVFAHDSHCVVGGRQCVDSKPPPAGYRGKFIIACRAWPRLNRIQNKKVWRGLVSEERAGLILSSSRSFADEYAGLRASVIDRVASVVPSHRGYGMLPSVGA